MDQGIWNTTQDFLASDVLLRLRLYSRTCSLSIEMSYQKNVANQIDLTVLNFVAAKNALREWMRTGCASAVFERPKGRLG